MNDCQVQGELVCARGADRVKIVGGQLSQIRLDCPRRVEIVGTTVGKLSIHVAEQSDGRETYRPQVTLEKLKLAEPAEISGDPQMVKTVDGNR